MLSKRIIPCLDVRDGKTTKGVKFEGNVDIGDPVEMARMYCEAGADELVFYDITASHEKRGIMLNVVKEVAKTVFVPFCVGGGIASLEDMHAVLLAGAEKVSVNSAAVKNPNLIAQGAKAFGNQCVVLGMDAKHVGVSEAFPSGYEVVINGGRLHMGLDAVAWARRAQDLGAGEICLNSIDADGTQAGYELTITALISNAVDIPVIASGGAGEPKHVLDALTTGQADAALVASMVHFGHYSIGEIKNYLAEHNVPVRQRW